MNTHGSWRLCLQLKGYYHLHMTFRVSVNLFNTYMALVRMELR